MRKAMSFFGAVAFILSQSAFAGTLSPQEGIANLMADYAWFADQRDTEAVSKLFVEQGVLKVPVVNQTMEGPAQVSSFFSKTWAPLEAMGQQRRHVITNIRPYDVQGDQARVRAYMTVLGSTKGGPSSIKLQGYYEAEVVDTPEGWRFRALTIQVDGMVP
ncbi:nuclear transport factor 2 family protein [Parahaliea mediterranea]|uniref:nuclear transport factor 2 family protein n=1 Tax=Parahaliea mediterranea TaxID=651086 RepID=UPI000E2EB67F|nr:nuclear transport factor 2 family protein [Parahaliea mediterranea]